ncbi:cysteine and histidine-rich domain-containing protein 1 [Lasius niger]|uniref:Cysteine and histidine-rich domain-containing protein 1 n=1 Tax=Lasius niger TaxID=67767 RepID=A0A0J7KP14_LASNI|nr:cysteine and histidine-rich domain-containing protein 1 [Lasius niger]
MRTGADRELDPVTPSVTKKTDETDLYILCRTEESAGAGLEETRKRARVKRPRRRGDRKQIVDIKQSSVSMLPTKVEIKLKKAELGSWSKLDIPREVPEISESKENVATLNTQIEAVDLSDL